MNQKTCQRAMRSFLASLLQSDLTPTELRQLADELMVGSFGRELGEFIEDVMLSLGDDRRLRDDVGKPELGWEEAYEVILRRRLSKEAVLHLMAIASPQLNSQKIPSGKTLKRYLEWYAKIASSDEFSRFLSIIGGESVDPYLKGITHRD